MTPVVIWPDVSHWQVVPVDDRFTRQFLMYKISDGTTYVDPNAARNGAWCHTNSGPGKKLVGHGGYHVWASGNEQVQADLFFSHAKVSPYFVAMIDVESWVDPNTRKPRYTGDHSASITKLANLFADKLGRKRVKVYANSGDLANLYPNRPAWIEEGRVKAKYSSFAPAEPWSGWQYTDGTTNWPKPTSYPRASAPFGNCDHNAFLGTLAQFAAEWGLPMPGAPIPTVKPPAPSAAPGVIPFPPHPQRKEDQMDTRILRPIREKDKPFVGEHIQFADGSLHHIVDEASLESYVKSGIPIVPVTAAEMDSYRREGMIHAPVKA